MFKRNQVEEAIARVLEPGSAKPSSEMRTRLKRLLETDRGFGRNKRSADPERANFAFYSEDGPGRGVENWFSADEAFALLTGLRLMRHGWPQGFAVAVLRRVKPALEEQHARILKQDPVVLFDERLISAASHARRSCSGKYRSSVPRRHFDGPQRPLAFKPGCTMPRPGTTGALRQGPGVDGV